MKIKIALLASGLAVLIAAVGIGCGGADQKQDAAQASPSGQPPAEPTPAVANASTTGATYPIDYCIVSGDKLGEEGEPVDYDYHGRAVKFCCNMCVKKFEANPDAYMARLDSAAAGLLSPPASSDDDDMGMGEGNDEQMHGVDEDSEDADGQHDHGSS